MITVSRIFPDGHRQNFRWDELDSVEQECFQWIIDLWHPAQQVREHPTGFPRKIIIDLDAGRK